MTDHQRVGQPALHDDTAAPSKEVQMSTHGDPTKDEYLELEKKVGAAESELAAELADAGKALDAATEKRQKKVSSARAELKRKAAARSRKHDSDGLQR
jgi:hypothetical protein